MFTEPGQVRQENENLRRLADALGGTVASVFGGAGFGEAGASRELQALSELLRLWTALPCDASRADAVAAVRGVVRARAPGWIAAP